MTKHHGTLALTFALGVLFSSATDEALAEFLILRVPGATDTAAKDIDGDLVVGSYRGPGIDNHGFLFDRRSGIYTTLLPSGSKFPQLVGISGSRMIGSSFLFDNSTSTYTVFKQPDAEFTSANGIDDQYVIGNSQFPNSIQAGFLYDIATGSYKPVNYADSLQTIAWAISGQNVVGFYSDKNHVSHGFLFDGTNYSQIHFPGMPYTISTAVDGTNVGGTYRDSQGHQFGYLFDGSTYTTLIPPWVKGDDVSVSNISDISGSSVVGNYYNPGSQASEAFLYDINTRLYRPIVGPGRPWETTVNAIFGKTVVGDFEYQESGRGFIYDVTPYPEPSGNVLLLTGLGSVAAFAMFRARWKMRT